MCFSWYINLEVISKTSDFDNFKLVMQLFLRVLVCIQVFLVFNADGYFYGYHSDLTIQALRIAGFEETATEIVVCIF